MIDADLIWIGAEQGRREFRFPSGELCRLNACLQVKASLVVTVHLEFWNADGNVS